ncbi:Pumilio y domain family member 6 [Podosphaera aphanis]|nr:Pumilio y domain family member 6 [Podosphaera aphanis]
MASLPPTKLAKAGTKRKSGPDKKEDPKGKKKARKELHSSTVIGSKSKTQSKPDPSGESSEEIELGESNHLASTQGIDSKRGLTKAQITPQAEDGLHPDRVKVVTQNNQSSKEAHAKKKQLSQERKAAKPLADDLARTKKIWERLRRKSHVPLEERKKLVEELFRIITGKVKDFVLKHDSVRVIQTAIKYANPEQKRDIAKELAGTYRELAESKYAKFLIGKLLVHGDDTIRDIIVPEFFGHVRRLIKHSEAAWILDDIYRGVATKGQKTKLLREWYGAEFSLFENDSLEPSSELSKILEKNPEKKSPIMQSLKGLITQLVEKKMVGFTILHDAMLQYFLNSKVGTTEASEFLDLIKGDEDGDLLKNLAFTKSGSRLVCLALARGNAKDRKHILRAYKDTLQAMATDQYAHAVILAAYEVIDDTTLTAKSIFPEILSKDENKQVENTIIFVNDLYARTIILYLFRGRSKALFPSSLNYDLELLEEIDEARTATSKKDPELRKTQLVKALSPYLLTVIEKAASTLVQTSFGCQFITEILFGAEGEKATALKAIAATAAGDPTITQSTAIKGEESDAVDTGSLGHIATKPHGGRMLKSLIAGGRFDLKTQSIIQIVPELKFADILYVQIKDYILEWAIGPGSFVVLALVESEKFSSKPELLSLLKSGKERLIKASKEDTSIQPPRKDKEVKKNNESQHKKQKSKGNIGSAMLLKLI